MARLDPATHDNIKHVLASLSRIDDNLLTHLWFATQTQTPIGALVREAVAAEFDHRSPGPD
jgi:hypothetical protein